MCNLSKVSEPRGQWGALAPAMLKPWGRKCLIAPAIICQVYQLVDSQTSISLYSFSLQCMWLPGLHVIAGLQELELTWRTQTAPKLLAAGALPWTPLGELTALPRPLSWWGGGGERAYRPLHKNPTFGSALRASSFGPSGLTSPLQCWFRSDATVNCSKMHICL